MTDRERLELAAKAAGYVVDQHASFATWKECRRLALLNPQGGHTLWNSDEDDGDALRLAVKLGGVTLNFYSQACFVSRYEGEDVVCERLMEDPYAATRRAITRAAAKIGMTMP